jgi:hypothetical protein
MTLVGVAYAAQAYPPTGSTGDAAGPPVTAASPPENPAVTTFATLPTNSATDNLCQSPDGTVYVSVIDEHRLLKVTTDGTVTAFADPAGAMHALGVACPTNNEIATVVYNQSFRKPGLGLGAAAILDFSNTATHVVAFDAAGKQTADLKLPANVALNGITGNGNGVYYAADSNSGSIYRIDIAARKVELWFRDDGFAPTAATGTGMNGIKVRSGWVYFSAPARIGLYKIQISSDGKPQGVPVKVEEGLRPDDFDVAANGDVYFPVGTTLYRVAASGNDPVKFTDPIPPGASALVSADQKWVYWSTRGGTGNQRVVRVAIR